MLVTLNDEGNVDKHYAPFPVGVFPYDGRVMSPLLILGPLGDVDDDDDDLVDSAWSLVLSWKRCRNPGSSALIVESIWLNRKNTK